MLKVNQKSLDEMERQYKGIVDTIMYFENAQLPTCSLCASASLAGWQTRIASFKLPGC